ncbi:MAG: SufE family protein, partial [Proteobacteria bacterium]|nr:SufE family protein [Pseudomonadota bacterium]
CASQVWLRMEAEREYGGSSALYFEGASDALIVSGVIEVLRMLYNGVNMEDVLAINAADQLARLGLDSHLSAQRSNGLRAMVERIRGFALENGEGEL